jgi:hypothetical protein
MAFRVRELMIQVKAAENDEPMTCPGQSQSEQTTNCQASAAPEADLELLRQQLRETLSGV